MGLNVIKFFPQALELSMHYMSSAGHVTGQQ